MQLSKDRILTTHVGSLPRPPDLLAFLEARERGEAFDEAAFEARLAASVREVVAKQVAARIDSVCDGEQSKISYTFYVRHRLSGIGAAPGDAIDKPPQTGRTATSPTTRILPRGCTPRAAAPRGSPPPRCRAAWGQSPIATSARSSLT